MNTKHHPNWWLAYLIIPLMIALLILAHNEAIDDLAEMVMQLVVVVLTFGGLIWWVNANQGAIVQEQIDEQHAMRQPNWTPLPAPRRRIVIADTEALVQPEDEQDSVSLSTLAVRRK